MGQYTAPFPPSTTTPFAPTAGGAVGSAYSFSREDHQHPLQTSVTGNAGSATALQTARLINGVSFDGTADITVPAGSLPVTPSTPSRVFGTAFQPNATKPSLVTYTVKAQVTNPLLAGSSTGTIQLLSDASNPPTTERCRVEAVSSVGVAVALALTTANTGPLTYLVPAGHYVRLVSTTSGTATNTIVAQVEEALG